MKKYFCDKCEKEMELPRGGAGQYSPIVTGFLYIKNKRFNTDIRIWIDWEDAYVAHLCRDCLIDGIMALDFRKPPTKISFAEDVEGDDAEFDSAPYVPAPSMKPRRS